jgi:hypothetical protein
MVRQRHAEAPATSAPTHQRNSPYPAAPRAPSQCHLEPLSNGHCVYILSKTHSIALAIVFAVYMPPQAPGPGQEFCTIISRSSSEMAPDTNSP